MICVEKERGIFRLDTPLTSYVMGVAGGGYLGHIYYGRKITDSDIGYLLRTQEEPYTPEVNPGEKVPFLVRFHFEYPCFGTGDSREACLNVRNEQGQQGVELLYQGYEVTEGKERLPGLPCSFGAPCQTLKVFLMDPVLELAVTLSYTVFDDVDVITRSVSVQNQSAGAVFLTRVLSACLDMDDPSAAGSTAERSRDGFGQSGFRALTFGGAWAREHIMQTQEVVCGAVVTESLKGEPGHDTQPFLAAISGDCSQEHGEVYAMHFVYSGNFIGKLQRDGFGSLRMVMGIHPETFVWKLEPQETFFAPETVLTYSAQGLGGMTRTLHDFYRKHLIRSPWQYRERPVLLNNWEATYFDFDAEKLCSLAREARNCGIEMLVCDDGWFGEHRDSPQGGLGDWFVNERKLRGGFGGLTSYLRENGMRFGLWFEPEMAAPGTQLLQEHPDWLLRLHGREPGLCRNQWVLDFSNPKVVEYLYDRMCALIRENSISYIKWDMNRALADVGSSFLPPDRQGELWHRHVLGVYALQERLLDTFPELLLENCSSGGARFDPGMLYYSPQIWCSDDMDPLERLAIQEGTALLYPLSCIGAHVCKDCNEITGRSVPFETRALTAMIGTFGYELDITQIAAEEREAIPDQIRLHKALEPLIQQGDYFRLSSWRLQRELDIVEVLAKDQSEGFVLCVQPLAAANGISRRICLRGLDPDGVYEVTGKWIMGSETSDKRDTVRLHGDTLMHAGYLIRCPKGDFRAALHRIRRI